MPQNGKDISQHGTINKQNNGNNISQDMAKTSANNQK